MKPGIQQLDSPVTQRHAQCQMEKVMGSETTHKPDAGDLLEELLMDDSSPSVSSPDADPAESPPPDSVCAPEPPSAAADEDESDDQVEYWLRPGPENVRILLNCPDPARMPDKWAVRIYADLEALELPEIPDRETIKQILLNVAVPGQDLRDHTLVMGQEPIPPRSARLQWTREFFAEGWFVDQDTDQIDFRERVENCSVHRNELLLRLYHEKEGEPGQDIYGNKIAVEKAEKLRVRCGKGVTQVDEGESTAFYSDLDGRVRFTDSTVAVDEVYQVTGNVGMATGNIRHTGSVTITGDVQAGMIIEADGDIVVKGMVEAATITCGGTLTVAGGILGAKDMTIRVLCNLEAKYIREADVSAEGDILVAKEIYQSQVRCRGAVLVPNGRITGGEVVALRGIRCATAGAPGATSTTLKAGVDFSMKEQMDLYYEKIDRLEGLLKPVNNALANIETHGEENLSETEQQVVENLALKRMNLQEAVSVMYMRVNSLMEQAQEEAAFHVVMFKEVWSGTTIWLGEESTFVKRSINKPRVALLRGNRARVLPLGDDNLPPESRSPLCAK